MRKRLSPPVVLFVLAPAVGELLSGSSPPLEFFNPVVLILLALMYGCGALVCRELVIRWGKGWWSLLLLGMAYGVYEEGIVVRSFFDPAWEDLDNLAHYGRWACVNWLWTEHLTHYHALISIAASVVLVEMMYPERRHDRWLSKRGWRLCWISLGLWIPLGLLAFPYAPPVGWYILTWLAVLALVWAARRLPASRSTRSDRAVPRPRRFWLLGFVGLFAYFFTVYATSDNHSPAPVVTMLLLAGLDLLALRLVLRWSDHGRAWDDRHILALTAGGLSFFIFFSMILESEGVLGMSGVGLATGGGLWRLARRVNRRIAQGHSPQKPGMQ
jgi:hypothetical protein